MYTSFPAGTISRARKLGLARAGSAVSDEDFIGADLAEPVDGKPGLTLAIFPTVGRVPGGPNLCRPAKLLIRVSLPDGLLVYTHAIRPGSIPGARPDGFLGSFSDDPPASVQDYMKDKNAWTDGLDRIGDAVARQTSAGERAALLAIYDRAPWKMLQPTYKAIAPTFIRWLSS